MIWHLVTGLIWLVGLLMLPGYANGFSMPKVVVWIAGGLAIIGCQWINPPRKLVLRNPWLGALFLWVSFLFVWTTLWPRLWVPETLNPIITYRWVTSALLPTMTCWISFLVMDVLVRHADAKRWGSVGQQLCALAGVLAIYALAQRFNIDPFEIGPRSGTYNLSKTTMVTVFGNPMLTANCLAILAPLCLVFKPTWCRLAYGLILLDLLIIQSATSLLACFLGSTVVLAFRKQWWWLVGLWLIGLIGMAFLVRQHGLTGFFSMQQRGMMWLTAFTFWKTHNLQAWIGYGLGSVEVLTTNGTFKGFGSLHCEPLQIFFELGLVGGGLWLGWLWTISRRIRRIWQMPKDTLRMGWIATALSFGIVACTSFPLRVASLLMIGVFIAAALETFAEESLHASYPA